MTTDKPLNVVIIGTGVGGLSAALALTNPALDNKTTSFSITVLEATPTLQAIGGIIVVQANGCRMLEYLGVYDRFKTICRDTPFTGGARRWEDGNWLRKNVDDNYSSRWGYPYASWANYTDPKRSYSMWNVHRAEYQRILYEAAIERGVTVRLGCRVTEVNDSEPSVTLATGEVVKADLIIAADGVRSKIRGSIFPEAESTAVTDTGMDVTRANIPDSIIRSDPRTAELAEVICLVFGPKCVVANVPMRVGDDWLIGYDFITPRTQISSPSHAVLQNTPDVEAFHKNWAPSIRQVFQHIKDHRIETYVWQMHETHMDSWVSPSGKVTFLGDACHGFTPFLGSGGTMAIEDSVALAECLAFTSPAGIHLTLKDRLKAYEEIRYSRAYALQKRSMDQGRVYSLEDGPMQQGRDKALQGYSDIVYERRTARAKREMEWFRDVPGNDASLAEWDEWFLMFDAAQFAKWSLKQKYGGVAESNGTS